MRKYKASFTRYMNDFRYFSHGDPRRRKWEEQQKAAATSVVIGGVISLAEQGAKVRLTDTDIILTLGSFSARVSLSQFDNIEKIKSLILTL